MAAARGHVELRRRIRCYPTMDLVSDFWNSSHVVLLFGSSTAPNCIGVDCFDPGHAFD